MNFKMIVLGIIMVIILYLLYSYLIGKQTTTITNLRYDKPLDPFNYSSLTIPNSTRYCYYTWIYVNLIDTASENIFKVVDSNKTLFSLDIINTTDLQVSILTNTPTPTTKTYIISTNFPIQSWQQVIVSFDNTNMDIYMNGKFMKSIHFNNTELPVQTSANSIINYGVPANNAIKSPDITIRLFARLEQPMDPQTAWNLYRKHLNTGSSNTDKYGLNLNISTNNKIGQSNPIF